MLIVSEALARCALQRRESRGAHSRVDFPDTDDVNFGRVTSVVVKDNGQMKVGEFPLPEMPDELKRLFTEDN